MTKKTTAQFARELLDKHSLVLVGEYSGAHNTVQFLCQQGHQNQGAATNVLQRGYKCKECIHGRVIDSKIYWDQTKLQQLQLYIQQCKPLNEIAEVFRTTKDAINNVIAEHQLARPKVDNSLRVLIQVLQDQGRELVTLPEDYVGTHGLVEVRCTNNHQLRQEAGNIISKHTDCPKCFHARGTSQGEQALVEFIKQHYHGWIVEHDRQILNGRELDLVLPDLGLCFEYNGSYWHSEHKVTDMYHLEKTQQVEALDYQLIHVHEYHWINSRAIVESRILSLLNKTTKLPARKCRVQQLPYWPKEFLQQNHLQGSGAPTGINYGLYYNHELVAVMTFAKSRYRKQYQYELVRFAQLLNHTIVGAASKLLKQFEQDYKPQSLMTYAHRDYSKGGVYHKLGFEFLETTAPGYTYNKRGECIQLNRHNFQKHKLQALLADYDQNKTELENMHNHNYYRVYDSGNLVFYKLYAVTGHQLTYQSSIL